MISSIDVSKYENDADTIDGHDNETLPACWVLTKSVSLRFEPEFFRRVFHVCMVARLLS